jgi:hypothetical protein
MGFFVGMRCESDGFSRKATWVSQSYLVVVVQIYNIHLPLHLANSFVVQLSHFLVCPSLPSSDAISPRTVLVMCNVPCALITTRKFTHKHVTRESFIFTRSP